MSTTRSSHAAKTNAQEQAARQARALWISVVIYLVTFIPYALIAILSGSML